MQYEASIYSNWLWLLPVVLLLAGIALLVFNRKLWPVGFGLIVASSILVLIMPLINGYWLANRHDMMDHVGYTIDLSNFSLSKSNPYPLIHVLPASMVWLGLKPNVAVSLMPAFCLIIYVAGIWFLSKTLYGKSRETAIATLLACFIMLPMSGEFATSMMIGALFPYILALYFRAVGCSCYSCHWCGSLST